MCSILIGYKNWLNYGHPKTLGQMNRGILGTCGNQYYTGTVRMKSLTIFSLYMPLLHHYVSNFAHILDFYSPMTKP